MSKIIINHNIKSSMENELIKDKKAIKNDNVIIYELDKSIIKVRYENNKIYFEKENNDIKIFLEFENNKNLITKYVIKDLNLDIILKTVTKKLIVKDNYLFVKYDLYMNNEFSDCFIYELEWREI